MVLIVQLFVLIVSITLLFGTTEMSTSRIESGFGSDFADISVYGPKTVCNLRIYRLVHTEMS